MTKEELKRQLHSYRELKVESEQVAERLAEVESKMTSPRGAGSDGMPHGSGAGDPMFGIVSQHIDLQKKYQLLQEKLARSQLQIEELISELEPRERVLMRFHYIDGLTFEQMGEKMEYAGRHIRRLHAFALSHLLEKMS